MCDQRLEKRFRFLTISATLLAMFCSTSSVIAQTDAKKKPKFPAADVEFFQKKVRPLLETRCFKCHGSKAKDVKGELLLDSRAGVLKGGETGPAVVPGKPEKSLLIKAIRYEDMEMPPRTKLPKGEIAILTKWVKLGLPWSKETPGKITKVTKEPFPLEARKRTHWAWKPVHRPVLPSVRHSR